MNRHSTHTACAGFHRSSLSRRDLLQVGVLGTVGLSLGDCLSLQAASTGTTATARGNAPARNVIQIFLPGGCSHLESWDPKPEAPLECRGPLGVVKSRIPGVVLGELMPQCAKILDRMTLIRSITGRIPDHGLGQYHLLTGYVPSPSILHPQMGAVVAHELGGMNDLPAWIGVPAQNPAAATGYLSAKFGCFSIDSDPGSDGFRVRDVSLPPSLAPAAFTTRKNLREAVEDHFRSLETDGAALDTTSEFYRRAYAMLASPQAQAAFSLDGESQATRDLYGWGRYSSTISLGRVFGIAQRMITARRLVEAGARFVSVNYEGDNGWDMHTRIKDAFSSAMPAFDHALAGLITDLEQRGLLDSTLVMVMTEFGRTPRMNSSGGRDHHARCFSMLMAGGGITRGQVYGGTDSIAAEVDKNPVTVEDYLATAYWQLGIDANKRLMAPGERPIDIIRGGTVVKEIIA